MRVWIWASGIISVCSLSLIIVKVGHEVIANAKRIIYEITYKVFSSNKDGIQSRLAIVVLIINVLSK